MIVLLAFVTRLLSARLSAAMKRPSSVSDDLKREASLDTIRFYKKRDKVHRALKELWEERPPKAFEKTLTAQKEYEDCCVQIMDRKRKFEDEWIKEVQQRRQRIGVLEKRIMEARYLLEDKLNDEERRILEAKKALSGTLEGDRRRAEAERHRAAESSRDPSRVPKTP